MRLGTAILCPVPMHIEIGDHALADKLSLNKVARQFDALRLAEFTRQGKLHFAGKLRILADLERLDIVPKPFAVPPGLRRILRQHHLGMDDTALGGEVVAAFDALVAQPRGRAIGSRRHRARACLAANDLDVKMIDRHRGQIICTSKRTSARRISAPSLEKFSGSTSPSRAVSATLKPSGIRSPIIAASTINGDSHA